ASWYTSATSTAPTSSGGTKSATPDSAWCPPTSAAATPPTELQPAKHYWPARNPTTSTSTSHPTSRPPQPKASTRAKNSEPRSTRYEKKVWPTHAANSSPTSPASPRPSPYDQSRP